MTNQNSLPDTAGNTALQHTEANHHLDTTGLICPEPVMLLHQQIRKAQAGEIIEVIATDPATTRDIPNFCRHLGHELISQSETGNDEDMVYCYLVKKKP